MKLHLKKLEDIQNRKSNKKKRSHDTEGYMRYAKNKQQIHTIETAGRCTIYGLTDL